MKPSDDRDPAFGRLLKEWNVSGSLPPRFQERVWKRIALAETGRPAAFGVRWRSTVPAWIASVQALLARPGLAAGYVTALLALGFVLGWERGTHQGARLDVTLSSRYVQTVDPYRAAGDLQARP